jgi:hypothetical protein
MADEVEIAALSSLSGLFRRSERPAPPPGAVCENCATRLKGSWCYVCGQEFARPRRSVGDILGDAFEGMFHADGRLWKTLPRLLLHPGQLTRDYVSGKRAPQAPPFSVFLVVVVIFVFVGGATEKHVAERSSGQAPAPGVLAERTVPAADDTPLLAWIKTRERVAEAQPERFAMVAETWEHRVALVLLPVSTLLLAALFAFDKRVRVHDHLVFSMHSLAFAGLVVSAGMLASMVVGGWATWLWLLLPIHLFVHMRGFYRTSPAGTVLRMGALFAGSAVCYLVLVFALIALSLWSMSS